MARPEELYPYFVDLTSLSGVGKKTRERLVKLCGDSLIDLLFHLPRELVDRERRDTLQLGIATLEVEIIAHRPASRRGVPHRIETRIHCLDPQHSNQHGLLDVVYFHAKGDYLRNTYPEGTHRLISGTLELRHGGWVMPHPDYSVSVDQARVLPKLEPMYSLTQGLSNRLMRTAIAQALRGLPKLMEWHRPERLAQEQWPEFLDGLHRAHHPESAQDLLNAPTRSVALRRLAADELLAQQLSLRLMRERYRRRHGVRYPERQKFREQLRCSLEFSLSDTQDRAIAEIRGDLHCAEPMLRLLMGEVGSGKTLVALMVMLDVLEVGAQCALMVPSETLARQHCANLRDLLQEAGLAIPCPLLIGSLKSAKKQEVYSILRQPGAALVVGTHALIQDKVEFDNLGLVVIDEQHRFGVHQRMALSRKAACPPEVLVMTATPIPRTLLMTHYGDLDVTCLMGRNPRAGAIRTVLIGDHRLEELSQRIGNVLARGERVFWVCPLREDSEKSDLAAAESRYRMLQERFPQQCFLLHGGLAAAEKVRTMAAFQAAEKGAIVVATTVIEVGIDIHDATTMIIESAEQFGLAQLHQLRGRVGRRDLPGVCVLLHGERCSAVARERLEMMRQSDDGFVLAEADLRLRGGGEILGTRQSGIPAMRLSDLLRDQDLLQHAQDEAAYIVQHDPQLRSPRGEALRVLLYLFRRDAALSLLQAG